MKGTSITAAREENRFPMKPLVALSAQTETDPLSYAIRRRYVDYLAKAGALTAMLPPSTDESDLAAALERFDGLFVPGGPDIHPELYGAKVPPDVEEDIYHRLRDESEIVLIRAAHDAGMPLLCVCRGFQAMNVAFGGTLHQDIRAHGGEIHWLEDDREDPVHPAHDVELREGSPLAALFSAGTVAVNSMHHQAVDRIGDGLETAAHGPAFRLPRAEETPAIEALYHPEHPFFLGVQWHPEYGLDDEPSMTLARAFVAACETYRDSRKARR